MEPKSLCVKTLKSPCFLVIWLALAILSYVFLDKKIAVFVASHSSHALYVASDVLAEFGRSTYYLIGFALLFLISQIFIKNKRVAHVSLFFLLAIIVSGLSCDILKIVFGRARPTVFLQQHLYGFYFFQWHSNMWSFPSGHATTIASLAMVLSLLYPRFWLGFFAFATVVASSRIIVGAHFLSDVMLGMYLGAIIVIWLNAKLKLLNSGGR
jgi:membrane-associated phospholipid phosphatase